MRIDPRFNGPPGSGHGGYTGGLLAEALGARAATVSLRVPPPLGREVALEDGRLLDGDTLIAEIEPLDGVDVEPPPFPGLAAARAATERYPWDAHDHPYPTCYVCGPGRVDGLGLFTGPLEDGMGCATVWTPEEAAPRFVWAAMDCPTIVPVVDHDDPDAPFLLARLDVERVGEVRVGEPHVVHAWELSRDGRKRWAGAVLRDAEGTVLARGRALWIGTRRRA